MKRVLYFLILAITVAAGVILPAQPAQATIDPAQAYDIIQTLTFNTSTGNCAIRLYRGSSSAFSGTVYYRAGTSGDWTELSVTSTTTTFPISSTTMQVGHNWNKSGDDYMTCSFWGETKLTEIAISQKAVLSGTMGNYFMYCYANSCSSLTSLDVPNTSSVTSVGNYFMDYYAYGCTGLTSLGIPDTSVMNTVGTYFMDPYASECTGLTSLILPAVGRFSANNVNWSVPSGRLGSLKGYVIDEDDLAGWKALTASGKTLYINYIQDEDNVILQVVAPTVTTDNVTSVEETTATGNGNITSLSGGDNCTVRGFQYDIDTGAPYANSAYDSGSFGTGAYTKALTGLTKGELYYIRAYATSPLGTGYGSEVTFLTKPDEPTGLTATAGDAKVDLSWTKGTGAQKTMVRFRTDGTYPTSYTDGTQAYFDTGTSYSHTELTNGTTYKYRAWSYATEGGLTQYSDSYTEASATPATVLVITTNDASAVEETTATTGGNITSLSGGSNATVRGVEYDIDSGAPYGHSEHTTGSYGTGSFDISLTGLTQGELYYYRAYATNPTGTGYGSEKTFLTKPEAPTSFNASAFSETQIDLSWTKGTGAQKTVIRAKKDSYPADRTDGTQIYNDTGTSYSHTGLTEGEHWYYRAWSYTAESTLEQYSDSYAEDNEQTRVPLSITTGICSGSSETWAILNGEITTADPLPVTIRGFDYGLTTSYGSDVLESGSFGLGTYKLFVENISKSTVFHYRAKAYNGIWKYGADRVFATKGSPALWEYFDTTADNTSTVYGANWFAQTFTTDNVTSRTVTSIILPLQRTGNSGDVIVSLRDTAGGKPTGIDLCYGTLSQDEIPTSTMKCQFTMNKETPLQLGTQYAIVVKAPNGDASNYVKWDYVNAGGEPNGTGLTSVNSGIAWTIQTWDYLFEIWGNQAIEIQDAKVFQSYKSIGDWLITVRYVNLFAPYYDTYDVRQYFVLQLVDSDDHVIAQSPLPAWGNRVGNLYLSAAQVSALDYGGSYTLRIYGTFGSHPYTEYIIQSFDWKGDDLTQLDSWVITSAAVIGDYYDDLLTAYVAGRGEVLNATGGTIFSAGINGLSTVRPALYQVYTNPINYVPETTDQSQRVAMSNWQAAWGADGTIMITRIANWFGIDGGLIGGMFFVIMMLVLALVAFPAGHTTAANVLSIPCLGLAVWFGLDLVWLIILALFAAFLLFKNQFMDK